MDDYNLDQLHTFLARSRTSPISSSLRTKLSDVKQVLHSNSARLRRLDLTVFAPIPELLGFQAPNLSCLTISVDAYSDVADPYILFEERVSSLRALAIGPVVLQRMPDNDFPHLTHLYLSSIPETEVANCISLLARTPNLEVLHLSYVTANLTWEPAPPITLPRLKVVTIDTARLWSNAITLLSRLGIPSHAPIFISNTHATNPLYHQSAHLTPVVSGCTQLEVVIADGEMQLVCESTVQKLLVRAACDSRDCTPWLSPIHPGISFSALTFLQIAIDVENLCWYYMLDNLSQLTELRLLVLGKPGSWTFIPLYEKLSQSPVVCPILSSLSVEALHDEPSDKELVWMLEQRALLGHPIRHVAVQPYPLSREYRRPEEDTQKESWLRSNVPPSTVFELRMPDAEAPLCLWRPRDWFNTVEMEKYWSLSLDSREVPVYKSPRGH